MSTPISFQPNGTGVNSINITAAGYTDITLLVPDNGFVLTDMCLTVNNIAKTGPGVVIFSMQLGVRQPSSGFFRPFFSFNDIETTTATTNINYNYIFARTFGSGLIMPSTYTRLYVYCANYSGLTGANFTLDLNGFFY